MTEQIRDGGSGSQFHSRSLRVAALRSYSADSLLKQRAHRGVVSTSHIKLRAPIARRDDLRESSLPIGQGNPKLLTPVFLRHPPNYSHIWHSCECA